MKRIVSILAAVVVFAAFQSPTPLIAKIPDAEQGALSASVAKWIKEQTEASKNEHGKKTKRGYYSRDFRAEEGENYLATVHIETGGGLSKVTERFELSIEKNGKGHEVVGSELKDRYVGMHRESHALCFPYDSFDFDREGMDLGSGKGTVCLDYYQDRISSFRVHGQGMTYSYAPPEHVQDLHLSRDMHALFEGVKKDHARELEFPPAAFLFSCDPDSCDELVGTLFTGLNRGQNEAPGQTGKFEFKPWDRALVENVEKEREENPFAHYRLPYRPGNRTWTVYIPREIKPFTYPGTEQGFSDFGGSLPGPGVHLVY